jgi:thiol-disulfide isomerase/thioredoxin
MEEFPSHPQGAASESEGAEGFMVRKLDVLTNVALIVACAAIVAQFAVTHMRAGVQAPPVTERREAPPTYQTGEKVPELKGIDYAATDQTLLLVVRESCGYCEGSMPFYGALVKQAAAVRSRTQFAVVSADPVEVSKASFEKHDVPVSAIAQSNTMNVRGTPTLILINARGEVVRSWIGMLDPSREEEVISAINRVATLPAG